MAPMVEARALDVLWLVCFHTTGARDWARDNNRFVLISKNQIQKILETVKNGSNAYEFRNLVLNLCYIWWCFREKN